MKRIPILFLLSCAFAIGACSTNQTTPTTVPQAVSTPVPATADAPEPASGSPTIEVTGDLSASVVANNFYIAPVKNQDGAIIGTMLYLNQDDMRVVFIRFPVSTAPGTYTITQGYTDDFSGTASTGNYNEQSSDSIMQFAATGGTLTLDSAGATYTGSYEFTAQDEAGKTITVSGTFADIPYEETS